MKFFVFLLCSFLFISSVGFTKIDKKSDGDQFSSFEVEKQKDGKPLPAGSLRKVNSKLDRHFDIDENRYVSRYELELAKTHLQRGYPLARKILEKAYDQNHTAMLEPHEQNQLQRDRASGAWKKKLREFKETHPKKSRRKPEAIPLPDEYVVPLIFGGVPGL